MSSLSKAITNRAKMQLFLSLDDDAGTSIQSAQLSIQSFDDLTPAILRFSAACRDTTRAAQLRINISLQGPRQ